MGLEMSHSVIIFALYPYCTKLHLLCCAKLHCMSWCQVDTSTALRFWSVFEGFSRRDTFAAC